MLCLNGQTFSSRTGKTSGLPIGELSLWGANTGKGVMEDAEMKTQGGSNSFETFLVFSFPEVSTKQLAKN